MAEAFAIVGLAAAIAQFIELGIKVSKRMCELKESCTGLPAAYNSIQNRIPLVPNLMEQAQKFTGDGRIDSVQQKALGPVIEDCLIQVKALENLLTQVALKRGASTWTRGKRSLLGILKEPVMQKIDEMLEKDFKLLNSMVIFWLANNIEAQKLVSQAPGSRDPIDRFLVPYTRDPRFVRREAIVTQIEQACRAQEWIALAGLGGAGKSQIAIEYCYRYHEANPDAYVFWVHAETAALFEEGCLNIGRKLGLPGWDETGVDRLELVRQWLSHECQVQWLIVLDNVDDASAFFNRRTEAQTQRIMACYLPRNRVGTMLITTRDRRVGERFAEYSSLIQVPAMEEHEAMDLLRSRIPTEEWSEKNATRLVEELAYLPLAITQAAAFIRANSLTLADYLGMLVTGDEDAKHLLSTEFDDWRRGMNREHSVIRTWRISFDQLSRQETRAAQILSLMCCLDYPSIPRMLLHRVGESEFEFQTAWRSQPGDGWLEHWKREALTVLAEKVPSRQTYENWPVLEVLRPHAQVVFSYIFTAEADLLQFSKLLNSAALYDLAKGKYFDAHGKCFKSLEIRRNLLPPSHRLTLESAQVVGETLLHCGELTEAKKMLQEVKCSRDTVLGGRHPDTLKSMSDLAITLLELDELAHAECVASETLERRQEILGADHPDTIASLNILSMLRQLQNRLPIAREMSEEVVRKRERTLGVTHPDTLMTWNNLGVIQYLQGDFEIAKTSLATAIDGMTNVIGPECNDIQVSFTNMAHVYSAQESLEEAEALYWQVMAMRLEQHGRDHPATLLSARKVAEILVRKGNAEGAQAMEGEIAATEESTGRRREPGTLLKAGLLFD